MSERISLFDELKKGGYETGIITTFNVDFPFYEDVLLRRMRSSGIEHQMLMVDRGMCLQAMADRPPRMCGQHYTLAPMACGGAFHPKVLLLLGKDKGFLAVGSHNVTLSGYGQNLEITNAVRFHKKSNRDTLQLLKAAYEACLTWVADYGSDLPSDIVASFDKVKHISPWLTDNSEDVATATQFLFSSKSTASLWQQCKPSIPGEITRITGLSAFFDKSLSFVRELTELNAGSFYLGVQPDLVHAPSTLLDQSNVTVVDSSVLLAAGSTHSYIHAKFLSIESPEGNWLVAGSANLSAPAWLVSGEYCNAEAVIARQDEHVVDTMAAMKLDALDVAPSVTVLPESSDDASSTKDTVALLLVAYDEQKEIRIPVNPDWLNGLSLSYSVDIGDGEIISFVSEQQSIVIERALIRPGELINLWVEGILVARLLLHNIRQIQQYATTGAERKLRHALGSFGTDAPEISMLFDCIDCLTSVSPESKPSLAGQRSNQSSSVKSKAPETLISELSEQDTESSLQRRRLERDGDIGLIMDVLMHSMKSPVNDIRQGLNEDVLGRNEEELSEAGDKGDFIAAGPTDVDVTELCQKKFSRTLYRLGQYLKNQPRDNGITAALGVLVIAQHLTAYQGEQRWIKDESLSELFTLISQCLLTDKDTFYQPGGETLHETEEWGRFLGYVIWLAYYADVALRQRLPLSASLEQKHSLNWLNASWLYLAQHMVNDSLVKETANQLIYTSTAPQIRSWFEALKQFNPESIKNSNSDFSLAKSPKGAFSGFRLVVDKDGGYLRLASVTQPGSDSRFGENYLSV